MEGAEMSLMVAENTNEVRIDLTDDKMDDTSSESMRRCWWAIALYHGYSLGIVICSSYYMFITNILIMHDPSPWSPAKFPRCVLQSRYQFWNKYHCNFFPDGDLLLSDDERRRKRRRFGELLVMVKLMRTRRFIRQKMTGWYNCGWFESKRNSNSNRSWWWGVKPGMLLYV